MKYFYLFIRTCCFLFILTTIFFLFFHPVTSITEDLGRHIISGQYMLQHHQVYKINLFSYTNPLFPYISAYWLSEIIFFLIFVKTNFFGLFLFTIIFAVSSWFILLVPFLKKSSIIAVSLSSAIFLGIFIERTEVRPEIFSYLFLSIVSTILFIYRRRFTSLLFLLIPLMLLWANFHIYFILGLGLLGIYCLDYIWYQRKNLKTFIFSPKKIPKSMVILFTTTFFSFVVSLINPNGISYVIFPFLVTKQIGYTPLELQNTFFLEPFLSNPAVLFFKISVIFIFALLLVNRKKTHLSDWLIAIIFTVLGIQAIRNLNLYVYAVFPLGVFYFDNFLHVLLSKKIFAQKAFLIFVSKSLLQIFSVCILFYIIFFSFSYRGIGFGVTEVAKNAITFFEKENLHGPIFNNTTIGSYITFKLFPKQKVFVDNRPEAYPANFFTQEYIPMRQNIQLFNDLSNKYGFVTAIITHTDESPIVEQLTTNPQWVLVYVDTYSAIFVKKIPENAAIMQKFQLTPENANVQMFTHYTANDLLSLADFFTRARWTKQEKEIRTMIFEKQNFDCYSLGRLIQLSNQNENKYASYINTFERLCH